MSVGHYENFPVASLLLPAPLRAAIVAIYRFARAADDLADESDLSSDARLAALAAYDAGLDAIERGEVPEPPPFPALARAIRAHALPVAPFRDLLSAFRQDVTTGRYATYAEVLDYCRRSANPIGRLLLALHGVPHAAAIAGADAVCTGLQLTNFWQDIALDWSKGRIYIPREDLARFDVSEMHIAQQRCDERWRALIAFEVARTRELLERGRPLTRMLPWRGGLELSAVIAGGMRILERIDAVEGDIFRHRPTLGSIDWCVVGWRTLVPARASTPSPA